MNDQEQSARKLPLPKWCYILLAVPTFYMPLGYLLIVVGAIGKTYIKWYADPLVIAAYPALYVTFAMWPIYVAWVVLSKRLSFQEKWLWLFIVTVANMFGMPIFYIFILRRYLGIEGRTGPRDEAALDRFLTRHEIGREELSPDQLGVLRSHFRNARQAKWGVLPLLLMAALMVYVSIAVIPRSCFRFYSVFVPTRLVVVDRTNDTKEVHEPDDEAIKVQGQLLFLTGANAGVFGMCGLLFAMNAAVLFFVGIGKQRLLIDFLKARKRE